VLRVLILRGAVGPGGQSPPSLLISIFSELPLS